MQARRLGSIFGRGEESPRAAVVCLPCDIFLKPGAAENIPAAARNLAARLGEISQLLGIHLPVYVLFTKLDRLSFFHDYVRNLTDAEAAQVLGATLAEAPVQATGVYAEQESARLTEAFNALFQSLADKRTTVLPRENEAEKLPGAYEFPREFRKLRTLAVQFLVDLCRPSQLSTGPFLRGFYFCGVRPVIVRDVAASAAPKPAFSQSSQPKGDATGIFRIDSFEQAPKPAARGRSSAATTRKVPQWVFLNHFFISVLLTDRAGLGASGSSVKTSMVRRVTARRGGGHCVCCSACVFAVSYSRQSRAMESDATDASGSDSRARRKAIWSRPDALTRLEALRQSLETLTRYEREGRAAASAMGTVLGQPHLPRRAHALLHPLPSVDCSAQTQAGLLTTLKGLPAAPGPSDDYGYTYDTLKAYLITTTHHDKSTQAFLGPLLTNRWAAGTSGRSGADGARAQAVRFLQPGTADRESLFLERRLRRRWKRRARYLSLFAGVERVYQAMLAEANKSNPSVNFNRKFPGSAEVVINDRDVAGAYTKAGWTFMQNAIKNAESFFKREEWVLGPQAKTGGDRAKLEQDLRARYLRRFHQSVAGLSEEIGGRAIRRFQRCVEKAGEARRAAIAAAGVVLAGVAEHSVDAPTSRRSSSRCMR